MSASGSLRLERLHVRRTPGISSPFLVDGLCAGVNIIHGPNGSGKSSTARAMEAALWPSHVDHRGIGISARYSLDGVAYTVELDAGRIDVQRVGLEAHAPELPSPELCHRYRLSLHELLDASEGGARFAAEIARQSAGGFDLGAAAEALEYREKHSAARKELQALRDAQDARRKAQERQASLHAQASRLDELDLRREAALRARERARVLERAIAHAEAVAAARLAGERLAELPEVLAGMHGDEYERACTLREKLAAAAAEQQEAERALHEAEDSAASLLPHGAPPAELVPALREYAKRIAALEQAVDAAEQRRAASARQVALARQQIGDEVQEDRLAVIDCRGFAQLMDVAREAESLQGALAAVDAELRHASPASDSGAVPSAALMNGIRLLSLWLQEESTDARKSDATRRLVTALWSLALLGALGWGLLAAALQLAAWQLAAGTGAVVLLVIAAIFGRAPRSEEGGRAGRERDYERLDLPRPDAWETDSVMRIFEQLEASLAESRLAERMHEWHRDASARHRQLQLSVAQYGSRSSEVAAEFGLPLETDMRLLALLAQRIAAWQAAWADLQAAEAATVAASAQLAEALGEVALRVLKFGHAAPGSASDVSAVASVLSDSIAAHGRCMDAQSGARRDAERAAAAQSLAHAELAAIHESAGLSEDDHETLRDLCAGFDEYREAAQALRDAKRDCAAALSALGRTAELEPSLLSADIEELRVMHEESLSAAGEHDALVREISSLETLVHAAKHGGDVERAQAEVDAAEDALRDCRERDLRALVGNALVQHVQRATHDQHRPAVFHRARELFEQVTRGLYRLDFDDSNLGEVSSFRALDTVTGRGKSLDELSSGTRVQLLLAVRVAFVETQEHGLRLPLFLDETLGTSDDHRARAIIDAILALAEDGRQVFYFTAQGDEVEKWRVALEARGVNHRMVDLARVRDDVTEDSLILPLAPVSSFVLPTLPDPGKHTHDSYGAALGVPPLRLGDGASSAHLWYLIHDPGALHHLLLQGFHRWGQLETVVKDHGMAILAEYPKVFTQARALARALDVMCEEAAVGHGRKVDRRALLDSGAVSPAMIDAVSELASGHDGDARSLLDALERRGVQRFQQKFIDMLGEYLAEHGYLDTRPRRSTAEIRLSMLGAVAAERQSGVIAMDAVDRLLQLAASPVKAGNGGIGSSLSGLTPVS